MRAYSIYARVVDALESCWYNRDFRDFSDFWNKKRVRSTVQSTFNVELCLSNTETSFCLPFIFILKC